jgi:hypothetical protein
MAANANIGRVGEAGAQLTSPNFAKSLTLNIKNNQRSLDALDSGSPVGINPGDCDVDGKLSTYFGSNAILQKVYSGTPSSLNALIAKNNQALIFQVPRDTLRGGNPVTSGKNVDIMLDSDWSASIDSLTGAQILIDRVEFYN